ncbi:MAG: ABC transporter ATP-binding protein [Alphaproteobacteria bacterium]|jgi:putative hydroxymethylpyrimidine transport system ATP-binding protein|nr:ABC transporter ATP-binding protein [Alphaproteobacteria bacterium]MDP6517053.1 ABC transporter ATP-binding protein [Alphaproteobacteria bacterium]
MTADPLDDPAGAERPPAVSVHNAQLVYATETLFAGLEFRLESGAITALLGPSGVGKTSLLRLIAGLAQPGEQGRVDCDDRRPIAGRIAYMAQADLLLPWLRVRDNVTAGARLRGETPEQGQAQSLLARVGMAGRGDAMPAMLSGGERQRAALARTLMENRPVVLMDEPFSALDAITRARLQELAVALLRGRTVLLVTHDPLEALRIADRIHVMAGRPATLDRALEIPGRGPRDIASPMLTSLYDDLMGRLSSADVAP